MNAIEKTKAYWLKQLSDRPPLPKLPWDKERPPVSSFVRETVSTNLHAEAWGDIQDLATQAGTTPQVVLLAGLKALLLRYTGQTDLTIGTLLGTNSEPAHQELPTAKAVPSNDEREARSPSAPPEEGAGERRHQHGDSVQADWNLVALRTQLSGQSAARDWVLQVAATVAEARGHLELPFRDVLELLGKQPGGQLEDLFNVALIFFEPGSSLPSLESVFAEHLMSCALVLRATEADKGLSLSWDYDAELFERATIERMAEHLANLLAGMTAEPQAPLERLALLGAAELQQLLVEWNATQTEVPQATGVHQLIEAQARATPEAVAVICRDRQLTYAELNARANQVASYLCKLGAGPEVLVGLCAERSIEMLVGLLGILKSGSAYLPLDPAYPRERLAFMIEDAQVKVLLTQEHLAAALPTGGAPRVRLDADWSLISAEPEENLERGVAPHHLAYVIYTSGSTGKPKGVMVEHRNVLNFFAGMDARIRRTPGATWLAVTSPSFDISVLELFWTLARGFKVVLYAGDEGRSPAAPSGEPVSRRPMEFSLFYFSSDQSGGPGGAYRLLTEGARFADEHGFVAVWTPERHFHEFGGLYPNPSVTSAALAMITKRVQIRSGSVVAPLHSPIRIAEEWSVVDNLSNGRAAISFASGWMPEDFTVSPASYANRKELMFHHIDVVRRLWRGERVPMPGPLGKEVPIRILPRPVQKELPLWLTAAGNPETFQMAGKLGMNLLTHLLGQSLEEVSKKVALYRQAWTAAGHPGRGQVTLMLHTFVGESLESVKATVREPLIEYLRKSADLIKGYAWAFSAFKHQSHSKEEVDFSTLPKEELDVLLQHAFERYFETSGLFGTSASCLQFIEQLQAQDIDEAACLIDFGVSPEVVLENLKHLDALREAANKAPQGEPADYSIPALIQRHEVTHLQCTPSLASMLLLDDRAQTALGRLECLMLGGEALPAALAKQLGTRLKGDLLNMYGPTETTVWSSTYLVPPAPAHVAVGRPIANTEIYILDPNLLPVPVGVPGELLIGGAGVARGYLGRAELTAQRFIPNPFQATGAQRLYRTGDLARYLPDGQIELLGRMDHQVKIRGHRVELGEIEASLNEHPAVRESVVVARESTSGDKQLVAYIIPHEGQSPTRQQLRQYLQQRMPEHMVPAQVVFMTAFPQTPNQKIDRKALPPPEADTQESERPFERPVTAVEEALAELWKELLEVPRIGRHDNFLEAGGHSLLAVQLVSRVRDQFGVDLSLKHLFERPTVAGLAEVIEAFQVLRSAGGLGRQQRAIVPLQPHGTQIPIFAFGGHNGDVFCFRTLVKHLGEDQPFFGLEPPGRDGQGEPLASVEALAAYFAAAIRAFRPHGPYIIAGFCAGGTIAFELARQLARDGVPLELVALFGAPYATWYRRLPQLRRHLTAQVERLLKHARALASLPSSHRWGYISKRLHRRGEEPAVEHTPVLASVLRHRAKLERATFAALRRYEPGPFAGRLSLFLPCREWGDSREQPLRWRTLAPQSEEYFGPSGCQTDVMLLEPYASIFAALFRQCRDRIDGSPPPPETAPVLEAPHLSHA